ILRCMSSSFRLRLDPCALASVVLLIVLRREKLALLVPLALFLALVSFLLVGLRRDPHEVPSPLINKSAPEFQLPQLQKATATFSAKEMRGKVWILNFWGTWCVACREEHPLLVQYAKTGAVPI